MDHIVRWTVLSDTVLSDQDGSYCQSDRTVKRTKLLDALCCQPDHTVRRTVLSDGLCCQPDYTVSLTILPDGLYCRLHAAQTSLVYISYAGFSSEATKESGVDFCPDCFLIRAACAGLNAVLNLFLSVQLRVAASVPHVRDSSRQYGQCLHEMAGLFVIAGR